MWGEYFFEYVFACFCSTEPSLDRETATSVPCTSFNDMDPLHPPTPTARQTTWNNLTPSQRSLPVPEPTLKKPKRSAEKLDKNYDPIISHVWDEDWVEGRGIVIKLPDTPNISGNSGSQPYSALDRWEFTASASYLGWDVKSRFFSYWLSINSSQLTDSILSWQAARQQVCWLGQHTA